MTPPWPIPAMTLPKINISLVGAVAQITLPVSNTAMASKNVIFRGKYWYALPQGDWKAALVIAKALPYQAILEMPPSCVVILGIAVAMMVLSSAAMKIERMSPIVMNMRRMP